MAQPASIHDPRVSLPGEVTASGTGTPIQANTATAKPHDGPVICVFCGASTGTSPSHMAAARELAQAFHRHGVKLVYGGGTVGIMGEIARTLVSLSGPQAVHGVIPAALIKYEQASDPRVAGDPQQLHKAIDEAVFGRTTVVTDMHSRKHMMAKEVLEGGPGSGFVALSGGFGTLEELAEVITWNQLGIHAKGIVAYNVDGYWDGLLQWVKTAVEHGFIAAPNAGILVEAKDAESVIAALRNYQKSEGRFKLDWSKS